MNKVATISGTEMQTEKPVPIKEKIERGLISRKHEFEKALPAHITFEKFQRTIMTALVQNPDLTQGDIGSLFLSAMKCATDGLLPDGREAAFVIFNTKVKEGGQDRWIKKIQYMPMWFGILKKIRQSKEVASVVARIVYESDFKFGKFEVIQGDHEEIIHKPYFGTEPRGSIIAAYCIATLTNGEVIREVMTVQEIEKVRRTSKSGNKEGEPIGIWKEWYEEMARKTVFRRLAKWLPQSAELLDRVLGQDDTLDAIESMGPAERMESNPKAISDQSAPSGDETDQALIENNPSMEMLEGQADLSEKVEAKQAEKENEQQVRKDAVKAAVEASDPVKPLTPFGKMIKAVERAIDLEETQEGLEAIFTTDYKNDFAEIKKKDAKEYQSLIDRLEARKREILGKSE
jgi:recombination protein RecT